MAITKAHLDKSAEVTQTLIRLLGVDLESSVSADIEGIKINLSGKDSALLIGYRGDNLKAFSHILRLLLRKGLGEDVSVMVDVGGYLEQKKRKTEYKIKKAIWNVKNGKEQEEMKGLDSYERKIAHTMIAREGLISKSIGKGEDRIFVIQRDGNE